MTRRLVDLLRLTREHYPSPYRQVTFVEGGAADDRSRKLDHALLEEVNDGLSTTSLPRRGDAATGEQRRQELRTRMSRLLARDTEALDTRHPASGRRLRGLRRLTSVADGTVVRAPSPPGNDILKRKRPEDTGDPHGLGVIQRRTTVE